VRIVAWKSCGEQSLLVSDIFVARIVFLGCGVNVVNVWRWMTAVVARDLPLEKHLKGPTNE
jgi:hypothetical protein